MLILELEMEFHELEVEFYYDFYLNLPISHLDQQGFRNRGMRVIPAKSSKIDFKKSICVDLAGYSCSWLLFC